MISVVTSTMRPNMLDRVIDNFKRQNVEKKELIIILNKNGIKIHKSTSPNIKVFHLDEAKTLGECLNYGISKAQYDVIAKFDDDDYYSPYYLSNSLKLLADTGASVIGKASIFVYFKKDKLLSLYRPRMNDLFLKNKRVLLAGGTLVLKRQVMEKVQFQELNTGEDVQFQKDCFDQKISLYSGKYYDYVLIRYEDHHQHSWKIDNQTFQKECIKIGLTENFEEVILERRGDS
ncbi:glycosyltransferase [Bacillus sp. EB01]|uniref:glycosyltransferase n=1 Tax=Bacillus sp. EB01 TaxID=1347086 RepID=UPI0006949C7F|nr:glycosyltransferase [Bacillus sp. EB01]